MKMKHALIAAGWGILGLGMIAAVNFVPMASMKTAEMESYLFYGIPCFAEPDDKEASMVITRKIAEKAEPVTKRLGESITKDISVIVYPDAKTLHVKTFGLAGLFLPDWYIGKNTNDLVLIISPNNATPERDREFIIDAGVHEYIHLLTDRRNKAMDLWLKEGFALYLAGQKLDHENIINLMGLSYKEFQADNSLKFSRAGGYTLAYVLMEYLIEEYGWEKTLVFLQPGSNFKSVIGCDKKEFLMQWKVWMSERYS